VITGDLDRAAELATEALELGTEIGIPDCIACYGTTSVSLAILGHPIGPVPVPEDDPVAPVTPILMALITPAADHRSAVRTVPLSALDGYYDLELHIAAAAAFAAYGTDSQRRIEYETLALYAGANVVTGGCAAHYGPVDYYLGSLAAALGDHSRAAQHFRDSIEACHKLGAPRWEDLAAAALARLETANTTACFRREGSTWRLAYAGVEVHLPDAKGLRDLATLLVAPGREVHVYTLLGRDAAVTGADPILDEEAKRRYRRRVDDLREAIEQADLDGDVSASAAASLELEAVTRELSAATGLHGRDRRLDDDVERARKTVSARMRDVLSRIAIAHPALGSHLNESVLLGVRCSYQPNEPIRWDLGRRAVGS